MLHQGSVHQEWLPSVRDDLTFSRPGALNSL
jgi:hypothetical protein